MNPDDDYAGVADLDDMSGVDPQGQAGDGPSPTMGLLGDMSQIAPAAEPDGASGLLPASPDAPDMGLFSPAATAAAGAPGGILGVSSGLPHWVSDLRAPSADIGPPYLQPPQGQTAGTAAAPTPTPLIGPAPQGSTDQKLLQTLLGRANDPTLRYDPASGTIGRYAPGPSAGAVFTPLSPDQVQMFKERQLGSASYPPGVKSPQEQAMDQSLAADGDRSTPVTIGPNGWVPGPQDGALLKRMTYAETANAPEDAAAIAWAISNRVGTREFGKTLTDVLNQRNGFQIVPQGGGPPGGSPQWQESAHPEQLTGPKAKAWAAVDKAVDGVLSGQIPDPTSGAVNFFSSSDYDGKGGNAPSDWYADALADHRLTPAPYTSRATGPSKNYFFLEPRAH